MFSVLLTVTFCWLCLSSNLFLKRTTFRKPALLPSSGKEASNLVDPFCIVVGSRRLMPPDALQPKAYCTNPGL